jgi:hypothetical protein
MKTMKFRCADAERPMPLALTSGHTCIVGAEPTELDQRWWKVAIERGCLPVDGMDALPFELQAFAEERGEEERKQREAVERDAAVRAAIDAATAEHQRQHGKKPSIALLERAAREAEKRFDGVRRLVAA